ncbi:isoamyl acetate-hydrolyzing esterase 1 homolog isoform X2 [Mya arenaria]|nr:isoamyl acetate-hydrolyzing esterase 1 homolog isoform X2 [Mya arenaria]XP_052805890.1 isoamyl acetate-hydrolyzing esterase 1 homolog isoform X2 [Mya arenaria]
MAKPWPKVFLFGDSLTQYGNSSDGCWAALIADFLQRKCDVVNRGFSGYNTRWCKLILPKLITKEDASSVAMVTVFLGANDSVDSVRCPKQHVPLEEFSQNMRDILQYLLDIGIERQKIAVISPPSCVDSKWEAECSLRSIPFGKYNTATKPYAQASMAVAKEFGTQSIDLYSSMMAQEGWEDMLNDGLHLSAKGSNHLFQLIKPLLLPLFEKLPLIMPYWADIDNENPHALLDTY